MPRRSVVPRRPRPARLPRRSKFFPPRLSPSTLPPAVVSFSFCGLGPPRSKPCLDALPTSFCPFFRSRQSHSADRGVMTSVSPQSVDQNQPCIGILSSSTTAIVPSTTFLFLLPTFPRARHVVPQFYPQKDHTHPEISKEGGVILHRHVCCSHLARCRLCGLG